MPVKRQQNQQLNCWASTFSIYNQVHDNAIVCINGIGCLKCCLNLYWKQHDANKTVTPVAHGIINYALVGALLTLSDTLGLCKEVETIYTAEVLALLGYVTLTGHPATVKLLIPIKVHRKIDPFKMTNFVLHYFLKPFRREKKAMVVNTVLTAIARLTILLTD